MYNSISLLCLLLSVSSWLSFCPKLCFYYWLLVWSVKIGEKMRIRKVEKRLEQRGREWEKRGRKRKEREGEVMCCICLHCMAACPPCLPLFSSRSILSLLSDQAQPSLACLCHAEHLSQHACTMLPWLCGCMILMLWSHKTFSPVYYWMGLLSICPVWHNSLVLSLEWTDLKHGLTPWWCGQTGRGMGRAWAAGIACPDLLGKHGRHCYSLAWHVT